MKAAFIRRHGGLEVIEYGELEDPSPKPGEVLVKVLFSSINRIDTLVRQGYPGIKIEMPHILGVDAVGHVEKVGEGVVNINKGDMVMVYPIVSCGACENCLKGMENRCPQWKMIGFQYRGANAEYINVPSRNIIKLEDSSNPEKYGVLPLVLLTSWRSLVTLGNIKKDTTIFLWGGSSGVGTISIQIAKYFGAKVITATSSDWKAEKLKALGADLVLNYLKDDILGKVREFTGGYGVDLVIDPVGSELSRSLDVDLAKIGGKIIFYGVWKMDSFPINWRRIYLKHLEIVGFHTGGKWELMEALKFVNRGIIEPVIYKTLDLEEVANAHRMLESGEVFGKIAIQVSR